jgi:hypothetical protein
MGRPLKIKMSGGLFAGLQEMTTAEIDSVAYMILQEYSSVPGTGRLQINGNSSYAHIGTFTDTIRPNAIGSHPVGTAVNSTNYVFRQQLTAVTPNPSARPFDIKYNGSTFDGLQEMNDSDIVANIIDRVQTMIGLGGIGTYKLQPSAPSGGTWVDLGTVSNTIQGGATTTTKMWFCTANASPPAIVRPLEWQTGASEGIKEMSDSMIKELCNYYRKEIISSGIGNYYLGINAPSVGTWAQMGTIFDDTRRTVANQQYSTYYAGRQVGPYTGLTVMSSTETPTNDMKLWCRKA